MHNYRSKGQHFNYSFLLCLLFFPSHLEVPACYVWLTSRSLWQLSTHTDMHTYAQSLVHC